MKLIALKSLRYPAGTFNGKRYAAGDVFEAKDKHGHALVATKKAELAPNVRPKRSSGLYTTRGDLPDGGQELERPEDVAVTAAGAPQETEGTKRRYARRDLRSED